VEKGTPEKKEGKMKSVAKLYREFKKCSEFKLNKWEYLLWLANLFWYRKRWKHIKFPFLAPITAEELRQREGQIISSAMGDRPLPRAPGYHDVIITYGDFMDFMDQYIGKKINESNIKISFRL
jgi:hypothetical protein